MAFWLKRFSGPGASRPSSVAAGAVARHSRGWARRAPIVLYQIPSGRCWRSGPRTAGEASRQCAAHLRVRSPPAKRVGRAFFIFFHPDLFHFGQRVGEGGKERGHPRQRGDRLVAEDLQSFILNAPGNDSPPPPPRPGVRPGLLRSITVPPQEVGDIGADIGSSGPAQCAGDAAGEIREHGDDILGRPDGCDGTGRHRRARHIGPDQPRARGVPGVRRALKYHGANRQSCECVGV